MEEFILVLENEEDLELYLDSDDDLCFEIDTEDVAYFHYRGSYEAVSIISDNYILETKNKILDDNILIKQMPVIRTDNEFGGVTVTIGAVDPNPT